MPAPFFSRLVGDQSRFRLLFAGPCLRRALLLVGAIAVAGYFARDVIFGQAVEVREVHRANLVQTVVASGRVMTPLRVSIGAVITERVTHIPVDEGQIVRLGDVLIVLDDRDERAALAQAQAALDQADAKLRQLREFSLPAAAEALLQSRANLRLAQQQYERNTELMGKGFISQAALDDAKRNLDVAESQLKAARLQVDTDAPNGSDYLMAQTARAQAQAVLESAKAKLEQTVIHAPADGVLIAREIEAGDVVQPGKELMVLAPAGETQIVVDIDEKNFSQLKIGQKALASADAYPREHFSAELFYINPGIDALRGSVEVKLRVPDPPRYLRQDMTVSVDIEVARRITTLVTAADAIFDAAGPQPWVLAVVERRATKRPVTLGLKGEGQVEILSGVVAGDLLIPAAAGVAPRQRVRYAAKAAAGTP